MARSYDDWRQIEAAYRAGHHSVREIARQYGVTEGAIRLKAKNQGWERDLTPRVDARVTALLSREVEQDNDPGDENKENTQARSKIRKALRDPEIVEEAARAKVQVVREHRKGIGQARDLAWKLLAELEDTTAYRETIAEMIEAECDETLEAGEKGGLRRKNLLERAMTLTNRVITLRELSVTMKSLVALEREAFSIQPVEKDDPKKPADEARRDELKGRLFGVIAKVNAVIETARIEDRHDR